MFTTLKKSPYILMTSLLLTVSSQAAEENGLTIEKKTHQEKTVAQSKPLKIKNWRSLCQWNDALKHDMPVQIADLGKRNKKIYWALGYASKVFEGDFSPVIQKTLIEALIDYISSSGDLDLPGLEASIFALGSLEGDVRTHFRQEIQKEGWFIQRNHARHTLYGYTKPCNQDDDKKKGEREKFRDLFMEAFESYSHFVWSVKELKQSVAKHPFYHKLDLHGREYTPDQMIKIGQYIIKYSIRGLMMDKNIFDAASMADLAKGMNGVTSLTSLNFYEVKINKQKGFDEFVKALGNLPGLTKLNMRSCGLGDSHHDSFMNLISGATNLKELGVGFNSLSEQTLLDLFHALKHNQFKGRLDLSGIQYTPGSIAALAYILEAKTPITTLDIGWSKLSNDSLVLLLHALLVNPHVTDLDLGHNKLDQASGAEALSRLLRESKTLQALDMGHLGIQPDHMVEIAQGLRENTSLTQLHLGDDNYEVQGTQALAQALSVHSKLKTVNLFDNKLPDLAIASLLAFLQHNGSIERFKLYRSTFGMESAKSFQVVFPYNRTLKELELSYLKITDEILEVLCLGIHPNTAIEKIHLSGNKLKNTLPLAQVVWKIPQIKSIHFHGDGCMDRKPTMAFAYMKEVRKLDCSLPGYNDSIMRQLAVENKERVLRTLEPVQFDPERGTLNLNHMKLNGQESREYFSIDEEKYKSVDKLHLKKVILDNNALDLLLTFLKSRALTEFSIEQCGLNGSQLYQILKSLKGNTTLKKLSVCGHKINDNGAFVLQTLLQKTTTLEELNLSKVEGYFSHIQIIAQGLRENQSLKTLHLRQHNLQSFVYWLNAFWRHPALTKVNCNYFWNIPIKEAVTGEEFSQTLQFGRHKNKQIWEKVTAYTLVYMKKYKGLDINIRQDNEEKILMDLENFASSIQEFFTPSTEMPSEDESD